MPPKVISKEYTTGLRGVQSGQDFDIPIAGDYSLPMKKSKKRLPKTKKAKGTLMSVRQTPPKKNPVKKPVAKK